MNLRVHTLTTKYNGLARDLRIQVEISAAFDPSQIDLNNRKSLPPTEKFNAIWDTGATGTVITQEVIDKCGLKPVGRTIVHGANTSAQSDVYLISVFSPSDVIFHKVRVTVGTLVGDYDALIGMDIIAMGDLAITNKGGNTTLSFRFPSIECIDFVDIHKKRQAASISGKDVGNMPCPCGSGKNFDKCCSL